MENLRLNVALLRKRVPNLTSAAKSVGLRPATVSNLCTGKIPVGRCEVRTLATLASLAQCSMDELILRGNTQEMIETKIKTLDLFAPIVKGGTVGLVARPGMGQLVVLAELFFKFRKTGSKIIFLKPEGEHPELQDLIPLTDSIVETKEQAYEQISSLGESDDIIFTADRSHLLSGSYFELREKLENVPLKSVTTFLLDLKGESVDEDLPYGPLDTLWQFDADMAVRHIYPAVNPVYSTSSLLEDGALDQSHFSLQQKAKKLLRRYRELRSIVNVNGLGGIPASELETYSKGERLEAYLTQPFYVAEEFIGKPGECVELKDTLNDVKRILDGELNSKDLKELHFIGTIS